MNMELKILWLFHPVPFIHCQLQYKLGGWSFYYLLKDFFIIWAWTTGPFLGIGKVVASDVF